MNTRTVNQQTANDVVRESLGLTADDLGMNPAEDAFTDDDDDNSGGADDDGDLDSGTGGSDLPVREAPQDRQQPDDDFLTQQQPSAPVQPAPQGRVPATAEIRTDGKGNLVDRKTGQVVARAGAEARMYQKMHRTTQAYEQLQIQQKDTNERLTKAVEIGTQLFERLKEMQNNVGEFAPEKHGLTREELVEAIGFAKSGKTDPVGTIKKLLTRAAAGGIDLTQIGLAGGNFDPKSLMDMVRQEIGNQMTPLRERTQRETEQERQTREANESLESSKKELNKFLGQNPEARQYLPVFQQVYSQPQFQHMSLGEVWSRLQLNLLRRAQAQQSQQRPANQSRNRNQRPPNGQSRPPVGSNKTALAPVDMSYEDIVRGLLPPS